MPATHQTVVIVHGTCGSPQGNWFPWLEEQLEQKGHTVIVPKFPTPENQSYENWKTVFTQATQGLDHTKTILIGHSIGCAFLLGIVQESLSPYKALVCVCPFVDLLGNTDFDRLNSSFVQRSFNWPTIQKNASQHLCYAGADDPYVPLALAQKVAQNLKTPLTILENAGHINAEFGFYTFNKLLKDSDAFLS